MTLEPREAMAVLSAVATVYAHGQKHGTPGIDVLAAIGERVAEETRCSWIALVACCAEALAAPTPREAALIDALTVIRDVAAFGEPRDGPGHLLREIRIRAEQALSETP